MIPKEYSENLGSLIEKSYKNVLSIIFKIKSGKIINYDISLNVCYIMKNYDYDYVNNVYLKKYESTTLSGKEELLINFIEVSKDIFKTNIIEDSHKLVEYWMVYANCIMGNECVKKFGEKCILRVQKKKSENENNDMKDEVLNSFLKIYNGESALYKLYNKDDEMGNYHNNIVEFIKEKHYYTHYTSPIRRFCDMYIHGLYSGIILENSIERLDIIIENMNKVNKNMVLYKNQSKIIDLIFNYIENEEYKISTYGYIIEINVEKNKMKVYFPLYGFVLKCDLIEKKFKEIIEIIADGKKCIIKIDKEEEKIYQLYNKYEMELYIFPKKYLLNERIRFIFKLN
jgi:exoribonuclease R